MTHFQCQWCVRKESRNPKVFCLFNGGVGVMWSLGDRLNTMCTEGQSGETGGKASLEMTSTIPKQDSSSPSPRDSIRIF